MRRLVLVAVVVGLAACGQAPVKVVEKRITPVSPGEIRSIAVLPFTQAGLERAPSEPGDEANTIPPADIATAAMFDAMRKFRDWRLVDPAQVEDAFRRQFGELRAPTAEEARAVGQTLGVDAVLRGQVTEWQDRIGTEVAARDPARVVFAVELSRMPSGERVWQGEYAEQQQSLTENLWDVGGFFKAGAKWVTASELARLGAAEVADRLHRALYSDRRK
jgi:hypothetical protein